MNILRKELVKDFKARVINASFWEQSTVKDGDAKPLITQ